MYILALSNRFQTFGSLRQYEMFTTKSYEKSYLRFKLKSDYSLYRSIVPTTSPVPYL